MNMDVRPLVNEVDLDWALAEVEPYFTREFGVGSPDEARFLVLLALIENYEDKHWPIDPLASVRPQRPAWRYKADGCLLGPRRKTVRHRAV